MEIAAIHLLRLDRREGIDAIFAKTFLEAKSDQVQAEAFRALAKSVPSAVSLLWDNWNAFSTRVRQTAVDVVLARNEGASLVIDALIRSRITRADLTAS